MILRLIFKAIDTVNQNNCYQIDNKIKYPVIFKGSYEEIGFVLLEQPSNKN
jgi:hypothetical protein